MREVAAGVQRHAEQPLVAELVAQLLPVRVAQVVDVLLLQALEPGTSIRWARIDQNATRLASMPRVRLRVGVLGTEQLAGVLGGERLDGVDVLAAGVEAVTDRALGVLVAEPGAHGEQHGRRGVVLAGDQLERTSLVAQLLTGGLGDPRLDRGDHLESRWYALLVRAEMRSSLMVESLVCDVRRTLPASAPGTPVPASHYADTVSLHEIHVCGSGVRPVRLLDMITADDDVPRGSAPRGPRPYAQHDLLALPTDDRA